MTAVVWCEALHKLCKWLGVATRDTLPHSGFWKSHLLHLIFLTLFKISKKARWKTAFDYIFWSIVIFFQKCFNDFALFLKHPLTTIKSFRDQRINLSSPKTKTVTSQAMLGHFAFSVNASFQEAPAHLSILC